MAKKKNVLDTLPPNTAAEVDAEASKIEAAVARKRKALRDLAALDQAEAAGSPEVEAEGLPGANLIKKIISDLNGEGSFWVYKHEDGRTIQVASYDLTEDWEVLMTEIIKAKGGGNYTIKFRDNNGQVIKSVTRTYDPISPAPAAAGGSSNLETLMAAMLKASDERAARAEAAAEVARVEAGRRQDAYNASMLEFIKAQKSGSFVETIGPLIPLLTPLIPALLKLLKPEEKDPLEGIANVLDIIDALKEKSAEPASFMETIGTAIGGALAPAAAALAAAGTKNRAPRVERRESPPAPSSPNAPTAIPPAAAAPAPGKVIDTTAQPAAAVKPAPAAGAGKEEPVSEPKIPLAGYIPQLLAEIESGKTAEDAARDLFREFVEAGQDNILALYVDNGDWDSVRNDPRLTASVRWVDVFYTKLSSLVDEREAALDERSS
jgi:hypothetical protein